MIVLEYLPEEKSFRAVQQKTKQLSKMGHVRKDGRQYLCIEEALYLVESGLAVVSLEKKRLAVAQLYHILESANISRLKYAAYSEMVQAGYVLKRSAAGSSYDYGVYNCMDSYSPMNYRLLVSNGELNTLPSTKELKKIAEEQLDTPLLIASGDSTNIRISKFTVLSEENLKMWND
uniref:tRNA-splicing endonuclease subunit Sen54 N-terminal domain-containing protein n=1 Tax=Ditylenchus dipsaci TaxID=166011 RepID=A0A915DB63_9BILA